MRIKVTFKADKLPILYRHRFMALIKEALGRADADYKKQLYPDKNSEHSEKVKSFAFSVCPPRFNYDSCPIETFEITVSNNNKDKSVRPPTVTDKVIPIKPNEYISMLVSSSDYEFMVNVYNGLLSMKEFEFNNEIKFTLQKVFMLDEKKIVSDEVVFKTLSPVLLEEQIIEVVNGKEKKKDRYILPPMEINTTDGEFNTFFSNIHNGILRDIRSENGMKEHGLYKPLEFVPIELKKRVIKHTIRAFWKKNPDRPVMKFTCFEGCFRLKGDPRDLQMLYQIGIGLRTGQGFGMVEVG
jgi:CRISPR-associated endoribonuclease Cas6